MELDSWQWTFIACLGIVGLGWAIDALITHVRRAHKARVLEALQHRAWDE